MDSRLASPFSKVVVVDLLQLSAMKDVPLCAMCGLKINALLYGWHSSVLPEEVLMLDADVVVLQPRQLLRMFAPIFHYDVAGVMEGYSRGWDGTDTSRRDDTLAAAPDPAGGGWEVNTGVLAVRRRAEWFVELWASEFRAGLALYSKLTGVDQSAFMWALDCGKPPSTPQVPYTALRAEVYTH